MVTRVASIQDVQARRDRPSTMARFSSTTLSTGGPSSGASVSGRSRSQLGTHVEDGACSWLQRSWSEPILDGSPTAGARSGSPARGPGVMSPCGLVFPSSLRATSGLHKRHQADMIKYGVRMMACDGEQGHGRPPQEPGDLWRGHAPSRTREESTSGVGRAQGMLVHVRNDGNPSMPPEQTYAMPHPFRGHAPDSDATTSCHARGNVPEPDKGRRLPQSRATRSWEAPPAAGMVFGGQGVGEIETACMLELYNAVVDGLAARLVVDTAHILKSTAYSDFYMVGCILLGH